MPELESDLEQPDILLFRNIFGEVLTNINDLLGKNPSIPNLYNKNTNSFVNKILSYNPNLTEKDGYVYGLSMSLFLLKKITF